MLTINNKQFEKIESQKSEQFVLICKTLLKSEHAEIFSTKADNDWLFFIRVRLKQARAFNILLSKNQYVFILSCASFPSMFPDKLPGWAYDILTWPNRSEDDKIVLFCKEIYIRNQIR